MAQIPHSKAKNRRSPPPHEQAPRPHPPRPDRKAKNRGHPPPPAPDRILSPRREEDEAMDFLAGLRPKKFREFIGQRRVVENLQISVEAARRRGGVLDHVLLSGPPGLGKTTLANLIGNEMETRVVTTSGPAMERPDSLVGILTNLKRGEVLFIDEIHRLRVQVEEYLYSAMEDFRIDIVMDKGPAARSLNLPLEPFTLIGSTTREGLLTGPMRSRFVIVEKLEYYGGDDLVEVARRTAALLKMAADPEALRILALRARGTPRILNRLLRRLRDVVEVRGDKLLTRERTEEGLKLLGVDECGLDATDRRILECVARGSGPIGLKTVAVTVGEEEDTIEEVYEPYLIQQGFLEKTPRGRTVTLRGRQALGLPVGEGKRQGRLF